MRRRAAIAVVASALLAGCTITYAEVGMPLPDAEGLEIGVTTKPEALAALGPPRLVRREFDGDHYTWRRTKSRSRALVVLPIFVRAFHYSNGQSRRDDLSLLFDHDGILRGVGLLRETDDP